MEKQDFILSNDNIENLTNFSEILKKDKTTIINEALQEYFVKKQEELLGNDPTGENAMTNLSYDEFWDDVDV
jgi:hypothetical protein